MKTSLWKRFAVAALAAGALAFPLAATTAHDASAYGRYHFYRGYQGLSMHHHHRGGGPVYSHGYQGPRPMGYHRTREQVRLDRAARHGSYRMP